MAHRHAIEAVDRTLQDLMNNTFPFGGKVVILSGDFRQILPVVPGGSRAQVVNACFRTSALYDKCKVLRLTENMRLQALRDDPSADPASLEYPNFLLRVGEGRYEADADLRIELPEYIEVLPNEWDLCDKVFPNIAENYVNQDWLTGRAVLTVKNRGLQAINKLVGDKIPESYREFTSADKVSDEQEDALRYPVEMLNTLTGGSALPDNKLRLKKPRQQASTEEGLCCHAPQEP